MSLQIQNYWEQRAEQNPGRATATTNDIHLRELEIATILETIAELAIPATADALDVGCGDGYSTLAVAGALPSLRMHGIDYSAHMIRNAQESLDQQPDLTERVSFDSGDATDLASTLGTRSFDLILTDRCLINLPTPDLQARAIGEIARHTRPLGYYLAIENFVEGQNAMNEARATLGLPAIPVRWHNVFFDEPRFLREAGRHFDVLGLRDFSSSYYFATRVIYSALCKMRGEEPDYDHDIHRLAVHLPRIGNFSPIRMAVLRRKAT
jgi:ubiquinone/menaquinone biosynthesis C-methylase UbiE